MNSHVLTEKSTQYIDILCRTIPGREVGSEGNRLATRFFEEERQLREYIKTGKSLQIGWCS